MKGKYAVRAANRLASIDNQLLEEAQAKVAELTEQLAETQEALDIERAQRGAMVLDRAWKLSQHDIAEARENADRRIAEHTAAAVRAAEILTAQFDRDNKYPHNYIPEVLPLLIPDQLARSAHLDKFVFRTDK